MSPDFSLAPRQRAGATKRRFTLAVLCMAMLVAQIDTAVVNLATRPIGAYFSAGVGALQWVVDSYNLVYAVLLLTGGMLADRYGRRRLFMAGAGVFTAASLLCAAAPTVGLLIGGRAFAGLGAALLLPASLAIIRVVWTDAAERGRALGIWAACNGLAMSIGPTLGGVLIGHFGWRSIFIVVVPLSLAALLLAVAAIPESSDPKPRPFDACAQILGALALGCLALGAIELHGAPLLAAGAFVVAVVALPGFIRVERGHGEAALVPLSLFGVREFRAAIIATAGMTFAMYGVLFLLPLTWQGAGLSAVHAGLALMPMALVFLLVSPLSGAFSARAGRRTATAGGVAVIGLGVLGIAGGAAATSLTLTEAGLMLTGLGMGIATGPLMGTAVEAVAPPRAGTASALINVARMAGATLGVAVLGAVYARTGGGYPGLGAAMGLAALVQLACASVAWVTLRASRAAAARA